MTTSNGKATSTTNFTAVFITRDGEHITFFWVCRLYNRETDLGDTTIKTRGSTQH
jgi:hypothetical protein